MIRHDPHLGEPSDPAIAAADYSFRQRRQRAALRDPSRRAGPVIVAVLLFAAAFAVVAYGVMEVDRRATQVPAPQPAQAMGPRQGPLPVQQAPRAAEYRPEVRTLRTCVSESGEKLVTDAPCPAGYSMASSREFVPDRRPTQHRIAPASTPRRTASSPAFAMPSGTSASEQARRRCAAAKAYEADYRERRGLKITYDELSHLSEHVRRECAGA